MPRKSAEARAAASWRRGAKHPVAPGHLSREARKVWREVVESRPVDYFEPGSLHLLETFCVHTVQLRRMAALMDGEIAGSPEYAAYVATSTKLSTSVAQLGQKLRLAIQTAMRPENARHNERAPSTKGRRALGSDMPVVERLN